MKFNKNILAVIAFTPTASAARLRANRLLTECPTDKPVQMACKVYKDGVEIASLDTDTLDYDMDSYEAGSCYNIFCEIDDTNYDSLPHVKFLGDFTKQDGTKKTSHDAWNAPRWLDGGWNGLKWGCMDIAQSCEDLDVTIQAWRNPSPDARNDPVQLANHICAEKKITCSCKPSLCDGKTDEYSMYRLKSDGQCETKCIKQNEFIKKESEGFSFCPCPTPKWECEPEPLCDGKTDEYSMYRLKSDGQCEEKCIQEKDFIQKTNEGFSHCPCETPKWECEPVPLCDGKDNEFFMYREKSDGQCEQKCIEEKDFIKKTIEGFSHCPCYDKPPPLIPPQNCVLKRGSQLFKFESWPEGDDVKIQVRVVETQKVYEFTSLDKSAPEFYIENYNIFMDLKNAQDASGIEMQFVSPRGEGGWNTCKYSPIGIDLDNSEGVSRITGNFIIDITGDGELETLNEWFGPEEGILIHTETEIIGGKVTGVHMFGDMGLTYANGFEKLALQDDDNNGIISGPELEHFKIWVDANSNVLLDDGELHNLSDYGIIGISTEHFNHQSVVLRNDGTALLTEDLWFTR